MTPEQRVNYYLSKDVEPGSLEAEIGETIRWAIAQEREACINTCEGSKWKVRSDRQELAGWKQKGDEHDAVIEDIVQQIRARKR